jgi:hypothetical protein
MNPYAEINFADELKIRIFKFYFIFFGERNSNNI